jgi:hypothetical protein
MAIDGLKPANVVQSILNAQTVAKTLRSRARKRHGRGELLYVIKSHDQRGTVRLRNARMVKNVRAEICGACGERYFDPAAADKVLSA